MRERRTERKMVWMSNSSTICMALILAISGCSSDDTFCCALGKLADNINVDSSDRATYRRIADSKNEEACKMEVDHAYDNHFGYTEDAVAQCAKQ
jgi:hypothetical protein